MMKRLLHGQRVRRALGLVEYVVDVGFCWIPVGRALRDGDGNLSDAESAESAYATWWSHHRSIAGFPAETELDSFVALADLFDGDATHNAEDVDAVLTSELGRMLLRWKLHGLGYASRAYADVARLTHEFHKKNHATPGRLPADAAHAAATFRSSAFRAFNRWMLEDWGFDYQGRIYAAPYIPLCDPAWAEEELEWAIANGAKMISQTPGRVRGTKHGSPGDPIYDGFWARMAEANLTLGIHSGDASYNAFADQFGVGGTFKAFDFDPLRIAMSAEPVADKLAAMACHGVFTRHPQLRVATVECGSQWVSGLIKRLKKVYGQMPMFFKNDPVEQFKRNVWVAPYYEDDLNELRDLIGADHVLFGSDYPHAEGLAEPTDFIHDCEGYSDAEVQLVMRDNAMGLLQPAVI